MVKIILAVIAGGSGVVFAGVQPPVFYPIPGLSPTSPAASAANCMPADGSVVWGASFVQPGGWTSMRWTPAGGSTQAVGFPQVSQTSDDGAVLTSTRFARINGVFQELPAPVPSNPSSLRELIPSGDGQAIFGNYRPTNTSLGQRVGVWTQALGSRAIPPITVGDALPNMFATDANFDGSVLVGYSTSGFSYAWRWDAASGQTRPIGQIGTVEYASAVSNDGEVVVGGLPQSGNASPAGYRWTEQSGVVSLGNLAGGNGGIALSLSADGSIIGGRALFGNTSRAYLWHAETGIVDLRTLLIARGAVGLQGWTLLDVRDMSADGRILTGQGVNPQGSEQAWYVELDSPIPAPSSALVLLASACWLGRARHRGNQGVSLVVG